MMEMRERAKVVYVAKLAEQAERYDEMADHMQKVGESPDELSVEERDLLSVAYKSAVGSRRAAWRVLSGAHEKERSEQSSELVGYAKEYRDKVGGDLQDICDRILGLLDRKLIAQASDGESKVFYQKMKADYYRYIAEFKDGAGKDKAADGADNAYEEARQAAEKELVVTHPIRLGLALNFSVFQYEVLNEKEKACAVARTAFEGAIAELDKRAGESPYKDSSLICGLLCDNLALWSSDQDGKGQ